MRRLILIIALSFLISGFIGTNTALAYVKGIYITQSTAENKRKMKYLIKNAKQVGINTFVIDYYYKNSRYKRNVAMAQRAGIHYVARIVVFPYGATPSQVRSKKLLEKRWRRIKGAIAMGAKEIQLDYIRYKPGNRPSPQNAKNILKVIQLYKNRLRGTGVKLQIDIFGVAATKPSIYIGQDVPLFAGSVDAICPMVYPSHYEPYRHHATRPYSTVLNSVVGLKKQLKGHPNVKVYAYIELYNYRYPMSRAAKIKYIRAQIQAARDAGANGWYAWSAKNKYSLLFYVLRTGK